jgi:hypothetical protein
MHDHLQKFNEMPEGWKVDCTFGSPLTGYIPICNGKSLLNGGEKGLLRRKEEMMSEVVNRIKIVASQTVAAKRKLTKEEMVHAAFLTQRLSREKFKEYLLQEILFDMSVCKIESWPINQYPNELKELIDSIVKKFKKKIAAQDDVEGDLQQTHNTQIMPCECAHGELLEGLCNECADKFGSEYRLIRTA